MTPTKNAMFYFHPNTSLPQTASIASHLPIPCQARLSAFQPFSSTSPGISLFPSSLTSFHSPNRSQFSQTVLRDDVSRIEGQDDRSMKYGQFTFSARPKSCLTVKEDWRSIMKYGQYTFSARPKACPTVKERYEYQRRPLYATPETISRRLVDHCSSLPGNWRYRLEVVQHPDRARACGFGNKDFRLISPAIFIKLHIHADNEPVNIEQVETQFFHLRTTLHDVASSEDSTEIWVKSSNRQDERIDNLVGNKSSICRVLDDLEGKPGLWFVFSSLCVRTEKDYFLRFSLHFLGWHGSLNMGAKPMTELATVDSNKFTVFRSKQFPGVAECTQLSKCFITQGVSIHLRQDLNESRQSRVKGQEQQQHQQHQRRRRHQVHHPYRANFSELNFQDDNIHALSISSIRKAIDGSRGGVGSEQIRN